MLYLGKIMDAACAYENGLITKILMQDTFHEELLAEAHKISLSVQVSFDDGWMDVSWWSSTPARGPQDGPNVHHYDKLIFILSFRNPRNQLRKNS
jgi:hypothetical protein